MRSDLVERVESYLNNNPQQKEENTSLVELIELQHLLDTDTKCYNHFMKASRLRFQEPSSPTQYIQQLSFAVLEFFGLDGSFDMDKAYSQQRDSIIKVQKYLAQIRNHIGSELPKLKRSKKQVMTQNKLADTLLENLDSEEIIEEEERFHKELYAVRIKNKKKHCDIALKEYQLVERALRAIYASVLFMHDHTSHALELMENTLNGYNIMQNWSGLGKTFFSTLDKVGSYRQEMRDHLLDAVNQSRNLADLTQPYTQQFVSENQQYVPE